MKTPDNKKEKVFKISEMRHSDREFFLENFECDENDSIRFITDNKLVTCEVVKNTKKD
jgi:hypothetical protein